MSVIRCSNLVKTFGSTRALDGLDLDASPGEVHGFLGPNGSGKSTTIRVLLGLLKPNSGTATLFGGDPWREAAELHKRLAYVPGDVSLWPQLTGGEVIDLLSRVRGDRHLPERSHRACGDWLSGPVHCFFDRHTASPSVRERLKIRTQFRIGGFGCGFDEAAPAAGQLRDELIEQRSNDEVPREADPERVWKARVPGPQTPGLVSTTTMFAGLLLTLTPFLWANVTDGAWTAAGWNEAATGIALTALGLARLVYPLPLVVATALGSMLGGWLTLAPLLLDYGLDPESTPATLVDILIGIAILLVTILGHTDGRSRIKSEAVSHVARRSR